MNFFNLFTLVSLGLFKSSFSSLLFRFEQWVQEFKVTFISNEHYDSTFEKWVNNNKFVEEINSRNLTFKLGHNQFSGMDSADFSRYLGISRILFLDTDATRRHVLQSANVEKVPESANWVTAGAVTPVKDQGQCGSCWSFSTTGALEGAYYAKYGRLESFSEQQLVDCDNFRNGGKDLGCNGGLMDNAFTWIADNGGLCSEQDYPYVSGTTKKNGACQKSCTLIKNSNIHEFVDIIKSSDEEMMLAVSQQPVSIAIEADQREFQLYKSGVFTGTCGTNLDHGVLLVGYGSQNGDDYYLVKNSWSTSWGDAGYIKLGRGKQYNSGDGQCGLLLQGSYPVL
jgi:C1A family cysteine protease